MVFSWKEPVSLARGTPEYDACVSRIEAIFAKYANKSWKKKLRKLRHKPLDKESWEIVKCLSRTPIHPDVGIPEHELCTKIMDIYNTNTTRRPEWSKPPPLIENSASSADSPFTASEIIEAIERLPRRKAPGCDEVPHEALQACKLNPVVLATIISDFNRYLTTGYDVPNIESKIVPIPKNNGEDVRPISLLPTMRKLLERVVMDRILKMEDRLHESQSGFRQKMSP